MGRLMCRRCAMVCSMVCRLGARGERARLLPVRVHVWRLSSLKPIAASVHRRIGILGSSRAHIGRNSLGPRSSMLRGSRAWCAFCSIADIYPSRGRARF